MYRYPLPFILCLMISSSSVTIPSQNHSICISFQAPYHRSIDIIHDIFPILRCQSLLHPSTTQIVSALMECILGIFRKISDLRPTCANLASFIIISNFYLIPKLCDHSIRSKVLSLKHGNCYELCVY